LGHDPKLAAGTNHVPRLFLCGASQLPWFSGGQSGEIDKHGRRGFNVTMMSAEFSRRAEVVAMCAAIALCVGLACKQKPPTQTKAMTKPQLQNPPAVQWTRTFAGWGAAGGNCVQQTADGGYIATGETNSPDSTPDAAIFLVKVDSLGVTEWQRVIRAAGRTRAYSVMQTADGGYVVTGQEVAQGIPRWKACLVKTDAQGNVLWWRALNQSVDAYGFSVVEMADRGFAVAAQRNASDSTLLLYRTDSLGNRLWWRQYRVTSVSFDYVAMSLRQASDGGFIIGTQAVMLKADSLGYQQWQRTFDDVFGVDHVIQTADGGYVATGTAHSDSGSYLLKTDGNGNRQWMSTYASSTQDLANWLDQTAGGGYVIAGQRRSEVACLVRTTQNGTLLWTDSLCLGDASCVRQTRDGGYIVTGFRYDPSIGPEGASYLLLTKLAPEQAK
jgi:hypothetical protein